jgi:hypothetical protein
MNLEKENSREEHFLIVGFTGSDYHIRYALENNKNISLLINKEEYKPEYEKLFKEVFQVKDIFDFNQIKSAISGVSISAVLTRFEDYISVVGALNEYLGLDGFDYQTSRLFANKYLMKKKLLEFGVPCANGVCIDDKSNIDDFVHDYSFPLILKKTLGTHSNFIYKVNSRDELEEKLDLFARTGSTYKVSKPLVGFNSDQEECDLLLEETLYGIEITIDTFVSKGIFTHTPICEYILPEQLGVDDSYLPIRMVSANLSSEVKRKIIVATEKALKALGANNCICHTELFYDLTKDQCWIIETTSRGGGYRSMMINHVTDGGYDEAIFQAVSGKKVKDFSPNGKKIAVLEYFAEKEGVIEKIDLDFLQDKSRVRVVGIDFKEGDLVKPSWMGGKKIVTIVIESDTHDQLLQTCSNLFNKIRVGIIIK